MIQFSKAHKNYVIIDQVHDEIIMKAIITLRDAEKKIISITIIIIWMIKIGYLYNQQSYPHQFIAKILSI